jgi:hypothetical protein
MNMNALSVDPRITAHSIENAMSQWISEPSREQEGRHFMEALGIAAPRVRRVVVDPAVPSVHVSRTWYGVVVNVPTNVLNEVNRTLEISGGASAAAAGLIGAVATGTAAIALAPVMAALAAYIAAHRAMIAGLDQGYGMNFVWPWPAVLAWSVPVLAAAAWVPSPVNLADLTHIHFSGPAEPHKSQSLDYYDHDGVRRTAAIAGGNWVTDIEKKTLAGVLKYQTWDGSKWFAQIDSVWVGDPGQWRFIHSQSPDFARSHNSLNLVYKSAVGPFQWVMSLG